MAKEKNSKSQKKDMLSKELDTQSYLANLHTERSKDIKKQLLNATGQNLERARYSLPHDLKSRVCITAAVMRISQSELVRTVFNDYFKNPPFELTDDLLEISRIKEAWM